MPIPEENIAALGLTLPALSKLPSMLQLPFAFVNVRGDRAVFSGHPKRTPDSSIAVPYGLVGSDLTANQRYEAARDVALSVLANIEAEIGELSRITGWVRVFGIVASAP